MFANNIFMRRTIFLFSLCTVLGTQFLSLTLRGEAIPERPEKLTYPELKYVPPNPAEHRVVLKAGPIAYLVPSKELPLIQIEIQVRTGEYLTPAGKEGLPAMTGYLLGKGGTRKRTAQELEERLAFLAALLNTSVGGTSGKISLNLLSKDLDEGLVILREVLTEPKFQEDRFSLYKDQVLQSMRQRNDDSSHIEARERNFLSYGEKFWLNGQTTAASLQSITRDDIKAFHNKWFYPQNFIVAVSGDFDAADMTARLEKLFQAWPFTGEKPGPIPTNTQIGSSGIYIVDKDVPQGRVSILLPGILRDDPDYFSVVLMNDILGGGGFTSRIVNRVRSDEGLAYSAGSSFQGGIYFPQTFTAAFQSKSRTVPFAISLVLEEVKNMATKAPEAEELAISKATYIEQLPQRFATKANVAATFADDELTGRFQKNPDYWKNYRSRLESIQISDLERVAKRFLSSSNFVILIVGKKEEIMKGHPNHKAQLSDMAGGKIIDLPLRDPLTMEPMKP